MRLPITEADLQQWQQTELGMYGDKEIWKRILRRRQYPGWGVEGSVEIRGKYVYCRKPTDKGIKEFTYLKESSWKRRHKKKIPGKAVPDNTEENYPYKNQLFCGLCGSRLVRHYNPKNKKVFWICNRSKRKGKESCTGVRVPDSVIRAWGDIKSNIYIEGKVDRNGKKRYSYSGKKPTESE